MLRPALVLAAVAIAPLSAHATVQGILLGTDAPPTMFGDVVMTPFPPDPTPFFTLVSSVASPLGGSLGFGFPMSHRSPLSGVFQGWTTWAHGYTGDVYFSEGELSASIQLPPSTQAFYFYVCPSDFEVNDYTVSALTTGGHLATLATQIQGFPLGGEGPGLGARGFAFIAAGGDSLSGITISGNHAFAIGEFGIAAVPTAPAAALLIAALGRSRRRD